MLPWTLSADRPKPVLMDIYPVATCSWCGLHHETSACEVQTVDTGKGWWDIHQNLAPAGYKSKFPSVAPPQPTAAPDPTPKTPPPPAPAKVAKSKKTKEVVVQPKASTSAAPPVETKKKKKKKDGAS